MTSTMYTNMKKKMLLLFLMALLPLAMMAEDVDGIEYQLHYSDNTADLVDGRICLGDLEIPETIVVNGSTFTVKSIGQQAFSECSGLTTVIIPNSVTTIGQRAFEYCI